MTWLSDSTRPLAQTANTTTCPASTLTITTTITVLATDTQVARIGTAISLVSLVSIANLDLQGNKHTDHYGGKSLRCYRHLGASTSQLKPTMKPRTSSMAILNSPSSGLNLSTSILPSEYFLTGSQAPVAPNVCQSVPEWFHPSRGLIAGREIATNMSRGQTTGVCTSWWAGTTGIIVASEWSTRKIQTHFTYIWSSHRSTGRVSVLLRCFTPMFPERDLPPPFNSRASCHA